MSPRDFLCVLRISSLSQYERSYATPFRFDLSSSNSRIDFEFTAVLPHKPNQFVLVDCGIVGGLIKFPLSRADQNVAQPRQNIHNSAISCFRYQIPPSFGTITLWEDDMTSSYWNNSLLDENIIRLILLIWDRPWVWVCRHNSLWHSLLLYLVCWRNYSLFYR